MFKKYSYISLIVLLGFTSCNKFTESSEPIISEEGMEKLVVSDFFNYETSKTVTVELFAKDNNNNAIPKVRFDVYTDDPANGGSLIYSGITDGNGVFTREYEFPSYFEKLVVTTPYIGLPSMAEIEITNQTAIYTFGGKNTSTKNLLKTGFSKLKSSNDFTYLGNYNSQGVPDYLEETNDVIDADFLDDVNNTLPERIQLPIGHPQYFDENNRYDLSLIEACNVYVTFVHEGAGYTNTLGYYVYDTDNPPATVNDIDEIKIIFPNISYAGSGGGLVSGNKVRIGQFPSNKSIGWILLQNAWSNNAVSTNAAQFYSNPDFNPESTSSLRQHTVLINDLGRNLILLGIEDLKREGGYCDHDFNDAVFYVTADPVQAVDLSNLPSIDYTGSDQDSDGVNDELDDYPQDPDKAFNNYFFTSGSYGTLAFEDMWPGTGDYDFNDLVIDYNFNQITNASNAVVEIYGEFVLKAFGASFHNGFGIDLGINPSLISMVSGYKLQESWASVNAKGLENNQTNAVILVFDDTYNLMERTGGIGVNTSPDQTYVTPDTIKIHIVFNQPVLLSSIGVPPYNPFVIVNQDRGHEIHLPDHAPTKLADMTMFNTRRDDSNPSTGRYYKTSNNLPWGIKIIEQFDYPIEKVEIINAHLKFSEWAQSGGTLSTDWFKNLNGYRNNSNIYQKPD
jgi:LruC domain-containing protein